MKALTNIKAVFDRFLDSLTYFGAVILGLMVLFVCSEVISRSFLNRPILWVLEVGEYSLVYITFLGAAWLLRTEGHVKVDIVLNRLNPRTQALLNIVTSILGAMACLVVVWYSAQLTWGYFESGVRTPGAWGPPRYPIYVIIPIGSLLLFIQFLRRTHGYLRSWRTTRQSPGE